MKIFTVLALLMLFGGHTTAQKEYDVTEIYNIAEPAFGTKVITPDGDAEKAQYIISPTTIKEGRYDVFITKLGKDLYRLEGQDMVIETKYCYELANRQEATLIVSSSYGYIKGKVIF